MGHFSLCGLSVQTVVLLYFQLCIFSDEVGQCLGWADL